MSKPTLRMMGGYLSEIIVPLIAGRQSCSFRTEIDSHFHWRMVDRRVWTNEIDDRICRALRSLPPSELESLERIDHPDHLNPVNVTLEVPVQMWWRLCEESKQVPRVFEQRLETSRSSNKTIEDIEDTIIFSCAIKR
jgi:hypothetical protein